MGKASRRKRERKAESAESRAFRHHMAVEEVDGLIRSAGFDPATLDIGALRSVSGLAGGIAVGDEVLLFLVPTRDFDAHEDFDRVVCRAGIKRFVRATMESDHPAPGTLLDCGLAVFGSPFGEYVVIRELSDGVRSRRGIEIEMEAS
jgi:hypothetical protein